MTVKHAFVSAVLLSVPTQVFMVGDQSSEVSIIPVNKSFGDDLCPCVESIPGNDVGYGIGCAPHDINVPEECSDPDYCKGNSFCDQSHCDRSWCYVDPANCDLIHGPSQLFDYDWSYATCGFMDSFTDMRRIMSLRDKVFQVGFNSNTGGYTGAYHPNGHFAASDKWTGPTVNFVKKAALAGGFTINITAPPDFLEEKAKKFFDSSSKFDLCVYAASLGYLDFCTALYTISDLRAASATWFELQSQPLFLLVFNEEEDSGWETFKSNFIMIFKPFAPEAWALILCFVLPIMGLLMLYHEYGVPGSSYPKTVKCVTTTNGEGATEMTKKLPLRRHMAFALYTNLLAFLAEGYSLSVLSLGGKVNLLGISFFILIVIAIYTANLAAILTQEASALPIDTLDAALKAGYTFCASRKIAEIAMNLHYGLEQRIVVDPPSIGGDGQAGFNCPKCKARTRAIDFMKRPNTDPSLYCDAAIIAAEDLDEFHSQGLHCNKTLLQQVIGYRNIGLPINDAVSMELISLMLQLQNEGVMAAELKSGKPKSVCPRVSSVLDEESYALTVEQLAGIWTITFTFAAIALLTKWCHPYCEKVPDSSRHAIRRFDQWGDPTAHSMYFGRRAPKSTGQKKTHDGTRDIASNTSNGSVKNDHDTGERFSDNLTGLSKSKKVALNGGLHVATSQTKKNICQSITSSEEEKKSGEAVGSNELDALSPHPRSTNDEDFHEQSPSHENEE